MLIDVVNENNKPIDVIERANVLKSGKNFRTVHAWLQNNRGEVLLQRLVKDHPRSPMLLGSSVAGYLNAGETYDEAIRRKALSEVGQSPTHLKKVGIVPMSDEASTKFVTLYAGLFADEPKTEDPKIDSFEAISVSDLDTRFRRTPEQFTATFRTIYEHLRGQVGW